MYNECSYKSQTHLHGKFLNNTKKKKFPASKSKKFLIYRVKLYFMDVKNVNKSHEHKFSAPILRMILANRLAPPTGGRGCEERIYVTDEKIKLM